MSGAEFHELTVSAVDRLTPDAVAIEFEVPRELATVFDFVAGEHVIVRRDIDGHDVRRSYSICVPAGSRRLRVAIKQVANGLFSTFANRDLRVGMTLEVTPPIGDFTLIPDVGRAATYCAIAAGSGITPVLSMLTTVLRDEPQSQVYLIYGNRDGRSVMFLEELAELKDRYLERFSLVHVLSREASELSLFEGRLEESKVDELVRAIVPVAEIDRWLLCGPLGVVEAGQKVLAARGVDPNLIGFELFFDQRPPQTPAEALPDASGSRVLVTLGGRTSEIKVDPSGPPILDYVLSIRSDAPYSCRSGACASCRALVTSGEVSMHHNWCLTDAEVAAGQVLSCQAHPRSDTVELTYDI